MYAHDPPDHLRTTHATSIDVRAAFLRSYGGYKDKKRVRTCFERGPNVPEPFVAVSVRFSHLAEPNVRFRFRFGQKGRKPN